MPILNILALLMKLITLPAKVFTLICRLLRQIYMDVIGYNCLCFHKRGNSQVACD